MHIWQKLKFQKNNSTVKKYKLCGVTLLRKEKTDKKQKYNILGVKLSKKSKHPRITVQQLPRMPQRQTYQNIKERLIALSSVKQMINSPEIKVVSFDIFDTLLLRPAVNPTDIFWLIAAKLKQTHHLDFLKYRLNAEQELNRPNATLDDIYDFIQKKHHLSTAVTELMKAEEIACEKQLLFRREDVYDLYLYAVKLNKKVIATSDMYLPSAVLGEILHKNGYTKISTVYVSCEHQRRKSSGELYNTVVEGEQVQPYNILHIGDNYHSDYKMALKNNITAIYYPSVKDLVFGDDKIYHNIWADKNITKDAMCRLVLGYAINSTFSHQEKIKNQPTVFADLATLSKLSLAPLMFHIASSIANNRDIQKTYAQILFASRDGYLPQLAYEIFRQYQPALPSQYVYAGRRAYFSALHKTFADCLNASDFPEGFTIADILNALVSETKIKQKILSKLPPAELTLTYPKNKLKIKQILSKHAALLDNYLNAHKTNAISYYQSLTSAAPREIIFDCGYSGSVSASLSPLMNKPVDKIYLWETEKNRKLDMKNQTRTFLLMKEPHESRPFATIHLVYEELFSPAEGGCLGFKHKQPQLEEIRLPDAMIKSLQTIRQETSSFMHRICELFTPYLRYMTISDTQALQQLLTYGLTISPFNETRLLADIKFPDPSGRADTISLAAKVENSLSCENTFHHTGFENPLNNMTAPAVLGDNRFKIGLHCHLYNIHLYQELLTYLKDFPQKFDLILTICDEEKRPLLSTIFSPATIPHLNRLIIKKVENKGRDVAPWLITTKGLQNDYDLFCHIHGKESAHFDFGENWRHYLYDNLISAEAVTNIINIFSRHKQIGCLFPAPFCQLKDFCIQNNISPLGEDGEINIINRLIEEMSINRSYSKKDLFFSEGTMMWYRPQALRPLFDLDLKYEDFPPEPIGVGGTIAHAIERLPAFVCQNNGYDAYMYNHHAA